MEGVPFQGVTGWSLSVIPMFIFMGIMLSKSGVTNQLYNGARAWLGWLPGGLAFTTNVAATGLNAATGSTIGTAYALGRIGIPEMLKAGYDKKYTLHAVLMGGLGAHLIPPSILLVVYAGIAETPVGPQLLAGMIPGLFLVLMFSIQVILLAALVPRLAGGKESRLVATWGERWAFARTVWPLPLLILVVLGGLYLGVFTPTEAGAFGALGASILGLIFLGFRGFGPAMRATLTSTLTSTAAIFFIIIGALYLTRLLALSGLARWVGEGLTAISLTRVPFLLLLVLVFLVLGTFLDGLAMTLISVPILLPIVTDFGVNPIWFGVFVVFMAELAAISPPIGILVFVIHGLAQDRDVNRGHDISLRDVWHAAYWLIPICLFVLTCLILFPEIVTWLPSTGQ
jgi:tripartite ATP-independent transporter DctM subunit